MAIACGVADSVLEHKFYPQGAPWLYGDNQSDDNPSVNGLVTWAFALITFVDINCFSYSWTDSRLSSQIPEHRPDLPVYLNRICEDMPGSVYLL